MQLTVIGPGCGRCRLLAQHVEQAAQELGVPHEIKKVTDLKEIMAWKVMLTPALAVDGIVKVAGRVPSVEAIKQLIAQKPEEAI